MRHQIRFPRLQQSWSLFSGSAVQKKRTEQEIGRGPARSDLAHWKYETYNLAKVLRSGKNEISATVWNFGAVPLAQISDRTGFVLQGDSEIEASANTDDSWEVEEEKGVETLPTPAEIQNSYYVAEPAERIDGSVFDWSWNNAAVSQGTHFQSKLAFPICGYEAQCCRTITGS